MAHKHLSPNNTGSKIKPITDGMILGESPFGIRVVRGLFSYDGKVLVTRRPNDAQRDGGLLQLLGCKVPLGESALKHVADIANKEIGVPVIARWAALYHPFRDVNDFAGILVIGTALSDTITLGNRYPSAEFMTIGAIRNRLDEFEPRTPGILDRADTMMYRSNGVSLRLAQLATR